MADRVEEWRDLPGYFGAYEVSSFGRVRSFRNVRYVGTSSEDRRWEPSILRQQHSRNGYVRVSLIKPNGREEYAGVHRLVAMAFKRGAYDQTHVNHIDGNKLNNCPENLEWATPSENATHAARTGLRPSGERHPRNKLTGAQIDEAVAAYREGKQMAALAASFGVSKSALHRRVKNALLGVRQ